MVDEPKNEPESEVSNAPEAPGEQDLSDTIEMVPVEIEDQKTAPTPVDSGGVKPVDGSQPPELSLLEARLASLEKEKKEQYERLLRTAADFDNFRKRTRKEVDDARSKAREEVLREMLPVLDNMERALAASQDPTAGAAAVLDGVKLVLRQAQSALERFEVKGFSALGEPFDPARHEAIAQVETTAHPPGTVCQEMQKGYTMGARLLRPALVAVAKAPPAPEPEPSPPPEEATKPE
jgi:molecular chaperone GrpE